MVNAAYERAGKPFWRIGNNFRMKLFRGWTPDFTGTTFRIIPVTSWRPLEFGARVARPVVLPCVHRYLPASRYVIISGQMWSPCASLEASRSFCFTPGGKAPGTHWTGSCELSRAVLHVFTSPAGDRTAIFLLHSSHCPEWAVPVKGYTLYT